MWNFQRSSLQNTNKGNTTTNTAVTLNLECTKKIELPALHKSEEQEHAPPVPWTKHMLSWILVQALMIPLSKTGSAG